MDDIEDELMRRPMSSEGLKWPLNVDGLVAGNSRSKVGKLADESKWPTEDEPPLRMNGRGKLRGDELWLVEDKMA